MNDVEKVSVEHASGDTPTTKCISVKPAPLLRMSLKQFGQLTEWQTANSKNEINGLGAVNRKGYILAIWLTGVGSSGGVVANPEMELAAIQAAMEAGLTINLQWHTHPGMSVFWSGTDTNCHSELNRTATVWPVYSIVFSGWSALARRFTSPSDYVDGTVGIGKEGELWGGYIKTGWIDSIERSKRAESFTDWSRRNRQPGGNIAGEIGRGELCAVRHGSGWPGESGSGDVLPLFGEEERFEDRKRGGANSLAEFWRKYFGKR